MSYDAASAMRTCRCELLDGAFETVECVGLTVRNELERLVVVISALIASSHGEVLLRGRTGKGTRSSSANRNWLAGKSAVPRSKAVMGATDRARPSIDPLPNDRFLVWARSGPLSPRPQVSADAWEQVPASCGSGSKPGHTHDVGADGSVTTSGTADTAGAASWSRARKWSPTTGAGCEFVGYRPAATPSPGARPTS